MMMVVKLRVWNIISPADFLRYFTVTSIEEALDTINREIRNQLRISHIDSSAFGLEVFNEEDQQWEEWQNDEGYEIGDYNLVNGVTMLAD